MLRLSAWILVSALAVGAAQAPLEGPGRGPGCVVEPGGAGPGFEPGRPGPMHRGPEPGPLGPPALGFMKLSAAQENAVKGILDQHRPTRKTLQQALATRTLALRESLEDPSVSEAHLRSIQAAESAARLQVVLEDRATFLEIHAVLSKDQQARAERLRLKGQKEREARQAFLAEAELE